MKKTLIAIASILAIVAGCKKADLEPKGFDSKIYATIEESDTKATLHFEGKSGENYLVWQAEDSISLFDGTSNIKCTLASEPGEKYGSFTPASEPATIATYYAVYPYAAATTLGEDGLIVEFPDKITYDAETGNAESGANIMVAQSSNTDFKFKNLCGYLGFSIKGEEGQKLAAIFIQGKDDQAVNGKAKVTFAGGVASIAFEKTEVSNTTIVSFGDGLDLSDTPVSFKVAVAPVFDQGFKAIAFLSDGSYQEITSNSTVDRNKIVEMPAFIFNSKNVCEVSGTKYKSFPEAIEAANAAEADITVKMLENVLLLYPVAINNTNGKTVTLDMNSKTIIALDGKALDVKSNANIIDNSTGKAGCIEAETYALYATTDGITVNIADVAFEGGAQYGAVRVSGNESVFNIGGKASFNNIATGKTSDYAGLHIGGTSKNNTPTVNIVGGEFNSASTYGVRCRYGIINISGGTFKGEKNAFNMSNGGNNVSDVTGGYFANRTLTEPVINDEAGKMNGTISGGYFVKSVTASLIKSGYKEETCTETAGGILYTHKVVKDQTAEPVASVGGVNYTSMIDAVTTANAAESNVTIKILKDMQLTKVIEITNTQAEVTIDLNGKKVSAPEFPTTKNQDTVALCLNTDGIVVNICDNSTEGNGELSQSYAESASYVVALQAGTLNISGGIVCHKGTASNSTAIMMRGKTATSTMNITGGYVYGGRAMAIGSGASARVCTVNITGGKIHGKYNDPTSNISAIGWRGSQGILNIIGDVEILAENAPAIYCGYNSSEIYIKADGSGNVPHIYVGNSESNLFNTGANQKTFFKEINCYTNNTKVGREEILTTSGATAHDVTEVYKEKTYTYHIYTDK